MSLQVKVVQLAGKLTLNLHTGYTKRLLGNASRGENWLELLGGVIWFLHSINNPFLNGYFGFCIIDLSLAMLLPRFLSSLLHLGICLFLHLLSSGPLLRVWPGCSHWPQQACTAWSHPQSSCGPNWATSCQQCGIRLAICQRTMWKLIAIPFWYRSCAFRSIHTLSFFVSKKAPKK